MPDSDSTRPGKKRYRERTETPFLSGDDCVLMIDPDNDTRLACVEAAVDEGCRPIASKLETAVMVAAENRPLVIVLAEGLDLPGVSLTDLIVSVGAQLVRTVASEPPQVLAERVRLAVRASRRIHTDRP